MKRIIIETSGSEVPICGKAQDVLHLYKIGKHLLKKLVNVKKVRTVKLGTSKQADRIYFLEDIDLYLKELLEKQEI